VSVFISMLQGINVGGQKRLSMDVLREIYQGLGFTDVLTYAQSGNVIFSTSQQETTSLTEKIEAAIAQACGFSVRVFTRLPADMERILVGNPYVNGRNEDLSKLHVSFLYRPVEQSTWRVLTALQGIDDEFAPGKMEIFLFCPNGYGKTKLSNGFFERKLGVPVTTRNWNTVQALYKMAKNVP
jgi:uncharacterized protein (DUF1697 family)